MKNKAEAEKKLRHTVELFRKVLEKAGVGYAVEELTRMNEKNVQVSEENGGEGVHEQQKSEYNEGVKYSQKINKYLSYSQIGNHNVAIIKRQLSKLYSGIEGGVADNIAIEIDNTVYVVDTGNQNGEISVGFLRKRTIKEDEKRRRYAREINQESYDRGFGNRTVFERLGADLDHNSGSNVGRELREDKANTSKHSSNNKNGVPGGASNRGVSVSQPQIKKSRKQTGETVTLSKGQIAALRANYEGDKVFTKKEVAAAISTIDALQKLPVKERSELSTYLWRGYNERLNEQGFGYPITAQPCIASISQELHIIKATPCISSSRRWMHAGA